MPACIDRRQFIVRSTAATAAGLVLPSCALLGDDDADPPPEPPPPLDAPAPNENRLVGVYAGTLMLEDGRAAPFDLVAHGEPRRPQIRIRLLPVARDPHLADGLFTTVSDEGYFEPRFGSFTYLTSNNVGPVLTLEGGLPPGSGFGTVKLIVRADGTERTVTGEIGRVSAPATTDTRIMRAADLSADCNAFTGPTEMSLVKTLTRGAFGSTVTTIDGLFEPTDRSQPHMRLYVNELSSNDSSFVDLGQIRSSRFDSYLYYYNPDPMGGLSKAWISESGTVRFDLVDPRTWRYTMHFERVRMRPFDGGATGTFEVVFSGTCNVGDFELNEA